MNSMHSSPKEFPPSWRIFNELKPSIPVKADAVKSLELSSNFFKEVNLLKIMETLMSVNLFESRIKD